MSVAWGGESRDRIHDVFHSAHLENSANFKASDGVITR
jgi:hypothetical protein